MSHGGDTRFARAGSLIFHIKVRGPIDDPYAPRSLASEGFIHCSYAGAVLESARLYFPADADLEVLAIDPAGLDLRVAGTPRGPMPHVHQAIPKSAIVGVLAIDRF